MIVRNLLTLWLLYLNISSAAMLSSISSSDSHSAEELETFVAMGEERPADRYHAWRSVNQLVVRNQSKPLITHKIGLLEGLKATGAFISLGLILSMVTTISEICGRSSELGTRLLLGLFALGIIETLLTIIGGVIKCVDKEKRRYDGESICCTSYQMMNTLIDSCLLASGFVGISKSAGIMTYLVADNSQICSYKTGGDLIQSAPVLSATIASTLQILLIILTLGLTAIQDRYQPQLSSESTDDM